MGGFAGATLEAGDGAQERVDRFELKIRHVLKIGPRHNLEQIAVERKKETVGGYGGGACGMDMIQVFAGPYDLNEIRQRVAALRQSGLIGCQIT